MALAAVRSKVVILICLFIVIAPIRCACFVLGACFVKWFLETLLVVMLLCAVFSLFLKVPWVGLWFVIVTFPGHDPFAFFVKKLKISD